MQHDLGSRRPEASGQDRDGKIGLIISAWRGRTQNRAPSPDHVRGHAFADRALWVPCRCGDVKADHLLPPSHLRAASWTLARSSSDRPASASSSEGSPLPAVFATTCHFSPSILSTGAPSPLTSTRARRFCAIGLFCLAALRNSATAAASFFDVPEPLNIAMAYSTSASTLPASDAACSSRTALSMSLGTPVPSL